MSNQQGGSRIPQTPDRNLSNNKTFSQSSTTKGEELPTQIPNSRNQTSTPINMNQPQPPTRNGQRPVPPIPADRTSINNRQPPQPTQPTEQEIENQRILLEQQEFALQQQKLLEQQRLIEQQQQMLRLQQQSASFRSTASESSVNKEMKANEVSNANSMVSTPETTRTRKQIVVNEINHKDVKFRILKISFY